MKDLLFYSWKAVRQWQRLNAYRLKRLFVKTNLSGDDFFKIPVIINNRNRFTFLKQLVDWLEKAGYQNIYILDNQSTYVPLLNYYKTIKHRVFFLDDNLGYKALWLSPHFDVFRKGYYVYTDPDVLPTENCPANLIEALYSILKRHRNIEKIGVALKIDDIPDLYANKQEVLRIESQWWKKEVEKNVYDAPVDTTFALYRPFAEGDAEDCKAYRAGGNLVFRHQPWYENSSALSEEEQFYKDSVTGKSSYWLNFK
jgi:hypothetical protein